MGIKRRSFLTTFEVSQLCEVNPTTVQNWVNEKKLKAYTTPGGHRRIRRADLIMFMKKFGMPLPGELAPHRILILVVDDETEVREMLADVMSSGEEEVEVITASGGVEALLLIGKRKPDLLILDLVMPGMNGLEVCKKLKSNPETQGLKIVAITGKLDPKIRTDAVNAGADLFFTKPLTITEFRNKTFSLILSRVAQ